MTVDEVKAAFKCGYGIELDDPGELIVLGRERDRLHARVAACEDAMRDALRMAELPSVRAMTRVFTMCEKLRAALRALEGEC